MKQHSDAPEGEEPNEGGEGNQKPVSKAFDIGRRMFLKVLAAAGIGILADQISGGELFKAVGISEGEEGLDEDAMNEKIHAIAKQATEDVEKNSEGLSEREKQMKIVDYCGVALFAWGVRDLMHEKHIHQFHYGVLTALTTIKYQLSTPEEKHHLVEETKANAQALGIISGTVVVAEGLQMDLEEAYEKNEGTSPTKSDKVALMTMFASVLSPAATTVGSASIIKKMSSEICDGNKDMMAICVRHISNLSGYILFGDPPFVAVKDKYGFKEGIKWQMETMWPLALYSLLRSTYQLNKILAEKEGLTGTEAKQKAWADSVAGIKNNIPVLAKMIGKSLANFGKYMTGADLSSKFAQDKGGIEVKIGEILSEKIQNLAKLPFSDEFDKHSHELHEGMVHDDNSRSQAVDEFVEGLMSNIIGSPKVEDGAEDDTDDKRQSLHRAIADRDYSRILELGKEMEISGMEQIVSTLQDLHDNDKIDDSVHNDPASLKSRLNPYEIYKRATAINRIKTALGHNLGDVVNVFPFQAGCVPFLTTAFKDLMEQIEKTGNFPKEVLGFLLIMAFSMIADNYVACKIGLEIFPDKPQIPLVAAIQGGSMSAIGNMANIAQFNLEDYSLQESFAKLGMSVEPVALSFAWTQILEGLANMGFTFATPPKAKKGAGSPQQTAANDNLKVSEQTPDTITGTSRRGFLKAMFGKGSKTA